MLHQPHIPQTQPAMPYEAAVMSDSNPYAYLSIMSEASKANDTAARHSAAANGNSFLAAVSDACSSPVSARLLGTAFAT